MTKERVQFEQRVGRRYGDVIALCQRLIQTGSENPPGDTGPIARIVADALQGFPGTSVEVITAKAPAENVVARIGCANAGRRLIINAHLDTFPVGDASRWTRTPLGGEIIDGRLYGRGAGDMKAGLATALMTARVIAEHRDALAGELVVTCVGDEETGGRWGTEYLLDNVPYCRGDAVLSADAGSTQVLRFGEKGQIWVEFRSEGLANHGAHVHLGRNAIEPLLEAIRRCLTLRSTKAAIPPDVLAAMKEARAVSEAISGTGEFETLSSVTVNVGVISGGSVVNIIPDRASARLDIRIPPGVTVKEVVEGISDLLADLPDVSFEVLQSCDPTVTSPLDDISTLALANARSHLGPNVVANMRVGMSDARFYRMRGMPTIVYGPAPHNMGGIDEYVMTEDIQNVFHVHAMTAFDYLSLPMRRERTS